MLRVGAVILNTDPAQAGAFWSQALGYASGTSPDFLHSPSVGAPELHLDATDRTHLDLWTDSAAEQQSEVDRLISLGAHRVEWEYPEQADFVVRWSPTSPGPLTICRTITEGCQ